MCVVIGEKWFRGPLKKHPVLKNSIRLAFMLFFVIKTSCIDQFISQSDKNGIRMYLGSLHAFGFPSACFFEK